MEDEYYDDYLIPDEEEYKTTRMVFDSSTIKPETRFTEKELFYGTVDGERLIDYLLENNLIRHKHIASIESHTEIVDLCFEYNEIDLLRSISRSIVDFNPSILDKLLSNDIIPSYLLGAKNFSIDEIKKILKYKKYDLFYMADSTILMQMIDGKTLLETLLDLGQDVNKDSIDISLFPTLIKCGRVDLIPTKNVSLLLKNANLNETYLDLILEYFKEHNDYSIKFIVDYINNDCHGNLDEMVQAYIIFHKHNLSMYLKKITKDKLFQNIMGEQLIDKLVDVDNKIVRDILSVTAYKDIDVILYLCLSSQYAKLDVEYNQEFITNTIFDILSIPKVQIGQNEEKLIEQLKVLLMEDMAEVDLERVISWFRYMVSKKPSSIELIGQIIKVKQAEGPKDKKFKYDYFNGRSCYKAASNTVSLNTSEDLPLIICHETGHMLNRKLNKGRVPNNYLEVTKKVKEDPLLLRRIYNFSIEYKNLRKKIADEVEQKYMTKYDASITQERKKEIEMFLNSEKEQKIDCWLKQGRSKEYIDFILGETYSVDRYLNQERDMYKNRLVDLMMSSKYGYLTQISDTIDSLFDGGYMNGMLKYNFRTISCFSGHGLVYYYGDVFSKFTENIANYVAIRYFPEPFEKLSSFDATNPLDLYREVMGDSFVNMIEKCYLDMTDLSKEEDTSITL